jgi:hypothetical protein
MENSRALDYHLGHCTGRGGLSMDRVQWIEYKGKKILYLNYSGLRAKIPEEKQIALAVMEEAKKITGEAKEKILFLSDVSNTVSDTDLVDALKELGHVTAGSGKVEKECVVGISGIQKALVSMLNLMTKSKLVMFDTVEAGKDYLAE